MGKIIRKNESYSELMVTEGATTIVDEDLSYEMKLPDWADKDKIKMGQRFVLLNMNAVARATLYGLMAVLPIESLTKVLMFTKQSSTPALSYRRYKANGLHAQIWFQNPIEPGSLAWQSIDTIRRMHVVVNKRSTKAGVGIISQKDMAITQFLFMGFSLWMPDKFGIVGSDEQFDAYNHFWRLIGFLLGTEDRFNACGETVDETQSRLQSIVEDMLLPAWKDPFLACIPYSKITFEGVRPTFPTSHYESMLFLIKRVIGVPGFYLFASESSEFKEENTKIFAAMSLYTKLQIILEIVMYEYLSHIFIFRWIFNIFRLLIAILDIYPVLAIIRFGKKYALVEVMKKKKTN